MAAPFAGRSHYPSLRRFRFAEDCPFPPRWSIEYHASGGRESIGMWVDRERFEHREQGQHTRFAPNGTIIAQAYWEAGTRVGWTKLWEDDGYPIGATRYVDGVAVEQRLPGGSATH